MIPEHFRRRSTGSWPPAPSSIDHGLFVAQVGGNGRFAAIQEQVERRPFGG